MVLFLSFFRMPISKGYPLREPVTVMERNILTVWNGVLGQS